MKLIITKTSDAPDEKAAAQMNFPTEAAERFFLGFEKSARRWERVVYPGMVILVLLMAYGFYLIYNLTNDMRIMVTRFDDPRIITNLDQLSTDLHSLSGDIHKMTTRVHAMSNDTLAMSKSTRTMTELMESVKYMKSMDAELRKMNRTMYVMGGNVNYLRQDMAVMNRNISRPMSMMNSMMPF